MLGASAIAALGLLVSLDGPSQASPAIAVSLTPTELHAQSHTPEPSKKLYEKLFRQASPEQQRALIEAMLKRESEARVLCGLTLLAADPSVDASMSKPLSDLAVDAKVRRIEPAICRGDESIR
jgi:hypothetical protein